MFCEKPKTFLGRVIGAYCTDGFERPALKYRITKSLVCKVIQLAVEYKDNLAVNAILPRKEVQGHIDELIHSLCEFIFPLEEIHEPNNDDVWYKAFQFAARFAGLAYRYGLHGNSVNSFNVDVDQSEDICLFYIYCYGGREVNCSRLPSLTREAIRMVHDHKGNLVKEHYQVPLYPREIEFRHTLSWCEPIPQNRGDVCDDWTPIDEHVNRCA